MVRTVFPPLSWLVLHNRHLGRLCTPSSGKTREKDLCSCSSRQSHGVSCWVVSSSARAKCLQRAGADAPLHAAVSICPVMCTCRQPHAVFLIPGGACTAGKVAEGVGLRRRGQDRHCQPLHHSAAHPAASAYHLYSLWCNPGRQQQSCRPAVPEQHLRSGQDCARVGAGCSSCAEAAKGRTVQLHCWTSGTRHRCQCESCSQLLASR
jgi:hypothetical protein